MKLEVIRKTSLGALAALTIAGCSATPKTMTTATSTHVIDLGLTRKDVRIKDYASVIVGMAPQVPDYSIVVVDPRGEHSLSGLNDLKGFVQISGPADALKFVRFRTSLSTYYLWHGDRTVEAIDAGGHANLPTYGIPASRTLGYGYTPGVFDHRQFVSLRLSPANVRVSKGQFVITRWLLDATGLWLERIRETVGPDGKYTEVLLAKKHSPNVGKMQWWERTPWRFPMFE